MDELFEYFKLLHRLYFEVNIKRLLGSVFSLFNQSMHYCVFPQFPAVLANPIAILTSSYFSLSVQFGLHTSDIDVFYEIWAPFYFFSPPFLFIFSAQLNKNADN